MEPNDVNMSPPSPWIVEKVGIAADSQTGNGKFRLRHGINSIGRHSASDLRIDSVHVSRHHAEITIPENENLFIELRDLNSINGTYINQKLYRATTAILRLGDIISFGAEYDEEDASELPIYLLKFEPLNPPVSLFSSVPEIVIIDDEDSNEQLDCKPVIREEPPPEKIAVSNILTIFGNANETILDGLQRINPKVCKAVKETSEVEVVTLSSDDEEPDIPKKSHDTMDEDLFNGSKSPERVPVEPEQMDVPVQEKYDSESENSSTDDNQIIYSQALIDEMKSEMVHESDEFDEEPAEGEEETNPSETKREPLNSQIILIDDDDDDDGDDENNDAYSDDFDEDLERKVSNWKNLLINSQIFPKLNCSQELFSDTLSDGYTSNDELPVPNHYCETAASEDSLIENLFRPLEKKLHTDNELGKKRTLQEPPKDDVLHSPVIKSKKRKVMQVIDDSDDSDHNVEAPLSSPKELNSELPIELVIEPPCEKSSDLNRKTVSSTKSVIRHPPIIVSPPHLKFGRRKSITITPKDGGGNGFLEKKRHRKIDPKLKELRKERLKIISAKKPDNPDENMGTSAQKKSKHSAKHDHKITTKVKNTLQNRGAFLCETSEMNISPPAKKQVSRPQIPLTNIVGSSKKPPDTSIPVPNPLQLPFFAQENPNWQKCIVEAKKVIRKNAEQARARNAPKKIRFADVEKSYEEHRKTEERAKLLAAKLNSNSATTATTTTTTTTNVTAPTNQAEIIPAISTSSLDLSSIPLPEDGPVTDVRKMSTAPTNQAEIIPTTSASSLDLSSIPLPVEEPVTVATVVRKKPKKTVRFIDEPTIHYFESDCVFFRKVDRKDLMPSLSYRQRRHLIRHTFPIIDRSDDIISLILAHSNEWLQKQASPVTALATLEKVTSMPSTFESFEHYKSIVFPLMKLEYMSSLKREMEVNAKAKPWNLVLDYVINNRDRTVIVAKSIDNSGKQMLYKKCDLVLLQVGEHKTKIFAYMLSCRKPGTSGDRNGKRVFIEILPNSIDGDYLNKSKSICIQSAIDNLQVTIGAYNAIYQVETTPLHEMLLNPKLLFNPSNVLPTQLDHEIASEVKHNNLNTEQLDAVKQIYKKICFNKTDTTPNISLIQGPPGTGKSVVVINLALQIIYGLSEKFRDKKILICAQSNCAIDSVAAKLLEARTRIKEKRNRFNLVRFGIFEKMHPKVHPISLHNMLEFERVKKLNHNLCAKFSNVFTWKSHLQNLEDELKILQLQSMTSAEALKKCNEKKQEINMLHSAYANALNTEEEHNICKRYLEQCNIVCTTLSSCVKLFHWLDYFDVCIIDEATQCTEPWTLLPLKFGISSLVLVGDSQQLPATVLSKQAAEYGLSRSLYTRIENSIIDDPNSSNEIAKSNVTFSLRVQYRMAPEICKFPNSFFYKNTLINAENTWKNTTPLMPYSVFNLEYAQNRSSGQGKITNQLEADFVVELLKALNEYIPIEKNTYGIITPYANQRKILSESLQNVRLPHVTVNTIDSYQGVEKDVIVISNARTNGIGFLANAQRLNVAITRPKKCLILCGNFRNLQSVPAWRCLLKDAQQRNVYHEIGVLDASDIRTKVIQRILAKD